MDEVVEIHLPMLQDEADKYFALEEKVTEALENSDLGSVDGNDIGQGEFTIFLAGTSGRALLDAVQPLLPITRLHPGAHAIIRKETSDEVLEEKVVLVPSIRHEEEEAKGWAPVGFGAMRGGDSPASQTFWKVFHEIWLALPTTQPSRANAAQVVVIWQLAGGILSDVDDDMKIKIENRRERMLGASVPIRNYPGTATECQAQIRTSLSRVLEMCRSLINRRRLDWDLTDVERVIKGIVGDG